MFIDAEIRQVEAAARIGAECLRDPHRPVCACVSCQGARPGSAAVVAELAKIRAAGEAIREVTACASMPGMRSTISTCSRWRRLPGVRELHIGHAIVSRAVFVGLREAVRQMKTLLREAAG